MSAENVPGYGDDGCCCQESYDASYPPPPPPPPPPPESSGSAGGKNYSAGCSACGCTGKLLPDTILVEIRSKCGTLFDNAHRRCFAVSSNGGPPCGRCYTGRHTCCNVTPPAADHTCSIDQATYVSPSLVFVLDRNGGCTWTFNGPKFQCPGNTIGLRCEPRVVGARVRTFLGGLCGVTVSTRWWGMMEAAGCCPAICDEDPIYGAPESTVVVGPVTLCPLPGTVQQIVEGPDQTWGTPGAKATWTLTG